MYIFIVEAEKPIKNFSFLFTQFSHKSMKFYVGFSLHPITQIEISLEILSVDNFWGGL
jgi:hypothetical protein